MSQGYDMEDAMIINKASAERGLAYGTIYKSEVVELEDVKSYFIRDPDNKKLPLTIEPDGLPAPGTLVKPDDPIYCYYHTEVSKFKVGHFHCDEEAYVDSVKYCGNLENKLKKIVISFRIRVGTS